MNERNINSETTRAIVAQDRNALAPRGGVFFDGTSGAKIMSTLTGQVIGTDSFSFSVMFRVPTVAPVSADYGGIMLLASSATSPNAVYYVARLHLDSDGKLYFTLNEPGGTGFIAKVRTLSSVVATLGGKFVHVVVVRNAAGNAGTIYINGVASSESVAGYTGSWQTIAVTSTYLHFGYDGTGGYNTANLLLTCASLYNLALDAASVLEIYELGGAVPERFKFGTQANRFPTGNVLSLGASDADVATGGNPNGTTWARTVGARTGGLGGFYNKITGSGWATWFHWSLGLSATSATYAVRFWARLNAGTTGNGLSVGLGVQGGSILAYSPRQAVTSTWTQYTHILPIPTAKTATLGMMAFDSQFSGSFDIDIDDVEVIPLGAVAHYDADLDGIGYQLHDQSTNKLDAWVSASGVAWTKPRREGYLRTTLTWAGTHESKYLSGEPISSVCMPVTAIVTGVTTKSSAASSGSGLSIAAEWNSANLVALNAFSTTKKIHALLGGAVPNGNNDPRFTRYGIDPDTVNFTGSIDVELRYSDTHGNP